MLSSDEGKLPTLKKERLSFYPPSETMADSDAARLEKEREKNVRLSRSVPNKLLHVRRDRKLERDEIEKSKLVEIKRKLLADRKTGRTPFVEKGSCTGEKTSLERSCT